MKYIKYYFQTLPILSFEMHTLRVARALKSVKWKCALYGFGTIYIIVILCSHSLVKALWYLYFTYQTEVKSCLFLFCLLWGKMHCVNCPKGGPWPSTSRLINLYAYFSKVVQGSSSGFWWMFIKIVILVHFNICFNYIEPLIFMPSSVRAGMYILVYTFLVWAELYCLCQNVFHNEWSIEFTRP